MRSITAAVLLTTLFTIPAMAQSWAVQKGSWNVPRIPSTNLSGSWGVKSESYGVKPESWGVKSESYGVNSGSWEVKSGSWGVKPIEPVKGWLDGKPELVKEMKGARVCESEPPPKVSGEGGSPMTAAERAQTAANPSPRDEGPPPIATDKNR